MNSLYCITLCIILLLELLFIRVQAFTIIQAEAKDSKLQHESTNCTKENVAEVSLETKGPPEFLKRIYLRWFAEAQQASNELPIARALRPISISYGNLEAGTDSEASILFYNISRGRVVNFRTAKIVFTLVNSTKLHLHAGSHMSVNVNFEGRSEKRSIGIDRTTQFTELDLTNFLKGSLNSTNAEILNPPPEYALLRLEVVVFKNNRRKEVSLKQVFDVGNDQPFLLFQYQGEQDPDSSNEIYNFEESSLENRAKRSSQLDPFVSPLCRRQEWIVKPTEVGLENISAPDFLDLGFCAGSCQSVLHPELFDSTLYSTLVGRYRALRNSDVPCNLPNTICMPTSFKNQILLETEESGFSLLSYANGAVESCGCT